ncbi:hypothetical protein ACRALDRAFT_1060724 [Sodiomyces alcalophilus JCM 7366]|uniref:uncharacterized protein n=1 Tax=Sodiomyces alcalophilus JCM 7366 TaxID=591952 RepID=UPI0039B5356B
MPNHPTSSLQPQQLSEEQECLVRDWATKERNGGTIVNKQLIEWFAERVIRRDGVRDGHVPDFDVDTFLDRHPDLAQRLVAPAAPEHKKPKTEKATRQSGLDRLREMRQQDATFARFGDSPPPPREPAPYPEGEVIHQCLNRWIVRHGDTVTKYTTYPHGLDGSDYPNEARALRFIKEHTTIPVPELISSDWDRVTMQYIEGQTLRQAWPVLTPDQRSDILAQLSGYLAQLRALGGIHLGRLNGQGVIVPGILTRSGGPFGTMIEFHDWLVQPPKMLQTESIYWHQITTQLSNDHPIVFTHGDIAARNIIVRDGRIVALLDWEFAGWYPEYWEYVFTLRGLDNMDWETLGRYVTSLFAKRYDLEYILVRFILSLS